MTGWLSTADISMQSYTAALLLMIWTTSHLTLHCANYMRHSLHTGFLDASTVCALRLRACVPASTGTACTAVPTGFMALVFSHTLAILACAAQTCSARLIMTRWQVL